MHQSKFEPPPSPPMGDRVERQPLVALLRRIRLPPEACIEDIDVFLQNPEAAEFLRVSPRTLQRLRQSGTGPPEVQISRRRRVYRLADLQRWAHSQSSGPTRETNLGGQMPEHVEVADPTKNASGVSEDLAPHVCGRCASFDDGHCYARGFAVAAEESGCPLFVRANGRPTAEGARVRDV